MIRIISLLLLGVLATGSSTPAASPSVQFSPLFPEFSPRGPVLVKVTIANPTSQSLKIQLGADDQEAFEFDITQPDGAHLATRWHLEGGIFDLGNHEISPGQSYETVLILNRWTSFDMAGTYQIAPHLVSPFESTQVLGKIEPFRLELSDDPDVLVDICHSLAKEASRPDLPAASLAASAFSYVESPICLPAMRQALARGRWVLGGILEGLGRIATPEAVEILKPYLKSESSSTALTAWRALEEAKTRTQDPTLKSKIDELLNQDTPPGAHALGQTLPVL